MKQILVLLAILGLFGPGVFSLNFKVLPTSASIVYN